MKLNKLFESKKRHLRNKYQIDPEADLITGGHQAYFSLDGDDNFNKMNDRIAANSELKQYAEQSTIARAYREIPNLSNKEFILKFGEALNSNTESQCWSNLGEGLLTKDGVDLIKSYITSDCIYDIISGSGYLGHVLKKAGIKVKMSDLNPVPTSKDGVSYGFRYGGFKGVKSDNAFKLLKRIDKKVNIFISWPDNRIKNFIQHIPKGSRIIMLADCELKHCAENLNFSDCKLIAKHKLPYFTKNYLEQHVSQCLFIYDKI